MDTDRNNRRADLIYKKHLGGGIDACEQAELDVLQREIEEELRPEAERRLEWLKTTLNEMERTDGH